MYRIISAITVISLFSLAIACGSQNGVVSSSSPTNAYKNLFAAVKNKDTEAIKRQMTKKTLELGVAQSQRNKKPIEQVYENGFTATTFAESLPNIRDERVNGDMGSVEVWNSKESKWEDLPFIKEDGGWKLAVGDMFSGSFVSPGPGRDLIEKQAANAVSNPTVMMPATNANSGPTGPKANKNAK